MNLVKTIEQYNQNYVYFCEPIKNNIITEGSFVRIIYSNNIFILNGVYLLINLNCSNIEKYYNKNKFMFNIENEMELINKLKVLEENLLKKINIKDKIPQNKIFEQLKSGFIKFYGDNIVKTDNTFILKISGIWETATHYGITYKFYKAEK